MHDALLLALASFPALPITMAAFLLLIQAAASAQGDTPKAKGNAQLREPKVDALWVAMLNIKTYVEGLARMTDVASARALIVSAGLLVAGTPQRKKLLFSATYVPGTGTVHLSVNATMLIGGRTSKKTTFTYAWSNDNGKTWSSGETSGYASHEVRGLPPGTYLFRVFATVAKVPGAPVQAPQPLTIPA